MCFTKPGAWLPAQRSAALCGCLSTERASLSNLCPEPILGLLPRWEPPKPLPSLCQRAQQTPGGFKKFAAIYPNRAGALLRATRRCPRAAAGQALPPPAPPRPGPRARPAGARPRRRGRNWSRWRPPRLPRTLRCAPHPPAQENKMFAAYDFQFQRLANGVQTSASSE